MKKNRFVVCLFTDSGGTVKLFVCVEREKGDVCVCVCVSQPVH